MVRDVFPSCGRFISEPKITAVHAEMSSTFYTFGASNLINGVTTYECSGPYHSGCFGGTGTWGAWTHAADPWAEIDLATTHSIGSVKLWGQNIASNSYGEAYALFLSDNPSTTSGLPEGTQCNAGTLPSGSSVILDCVGSGRYVQVMMPGSARKSRSQR